MNAKTEKDFERLQHWRFYWDWLSCVGPIVAMALICEKIHFAFYFLFLYFLGNRFFKLAALGHEALHHLISRTPWWNNFLGRYLCHFPTFISHSRYKTIHTLHHRFLGENHDPDLFLYQEFPISLSFWLKTKLKELFTLKIFFDFCEYYTEIPEKIRYLCGQKSSQLKLIRSDFFEFCIFWIFTITVISYFGFWNYVLLYWLLPCLLHLPILQLANGFQHGGFKSKAESRTVTGPQWIINFVIPLELNYHSEHHFNTQIPHYNLKAYAKFLKQKMTVPPGAETHQNLSSSFKSIFRLR